MNAQKMILESPATRVSFLLLWVLLCALGMADIAHAAPAFQAAGAAVNAGTKTTVAIAALIVWLRPPVGLNICKRMLAYAATGRFAACCQ